MQLCLPCLFPSEVTVPMHPHVLQRWLPQHSRANRWAQGSAEGCLVLQAATSS